MLCSNDVENKKIKKTSVAVSLVRVKTRDTGLGKLLFILRVWCTAVTRRRPLNSLNRSSEKKTFTTTYCKH